MDGNRTDYLHVRMFVEVGDALVGKFRQIFLRDGQSRKIQQSLSDFVPQANDCEQYISRDSISPLR